ncbi:hypothetical protein ACFVFQ_28705 [Streptomyces sp. NPDC057743]|uniref:hypothetical protein n=1 Tax=Streptomyces sp. NPDC057743 TaxID=3346236 RepID=UPI00369AF1B9
MGDFAEAVRERVHRARDAVAAAHEAGDVYAVTEAKEELDDALRMARDLGVDPGVEPEDDHEDPA